MQRPTYIVTGGAGFVGSNLAATLQARGGHVVIVDNFRTGSFGNLVDACERLGSGAFKGEVVPASSRETDWDRALQDREPRAVFHLGAITDTTVMDEREMIRENAQGFSDMICACVRRSVPLVYASSAATYGTPPQTHDRVPFPESAAGKPNNVYGFSKWLMECEHRKAAEESRDPGSSEPWIVGLRYFNVYGPGERAKGKMSSMPYQLAVQMLKGERPRIFRDGEQARDQVHVDDVVSCTLAAAGIREGESLVALGATRCTIKPGVYNLGSGVATSFNEIVSALRSAFELPESARATDYFDMPPAIRAFYQDYTCADMSATHRGLGWRPAIKPRDGIASYGAYLKERRPRV
jgi:ADP-L-glycero-D-manno-heptose 6-epimerase